MLKLVTYDLHKPQKDYTLLFKALKTYNWAHPLGSVWFLKTNKSVSEIMEHLKQHTDADDRLIITTVTDWHILRLDPAVVDWLKRK